MKIGDKVIITGNRTNWIIHEFKIGEKVIIIYIDDDTVFVSNRIGLYQWVSCEDIKMEDE